MPADVSKIEGRIPYHFGQDAVEVPGARALLNQLEQAGAPWIIGEGERLHLQRSWLLTKAVTSGTRPLVTGWLDVMKMAVPRMLVVAEDVNQGKPDPSCYLLGCTRLGLNKNAHMLVLEDSPSGVKAGKAAGFTVIGLATTHAIAKLQACGADYIVRDMRSVNMQGWDQKTGKVEIQISNALIE